MDYPHKLISSTCHSRAGGNPGLFSAELAWIPAFAGMTDPGGIFTAQIISGLVFSKEDMKSMKKIDKSPRFTLSGI